MVVLINRHVLHAAKPRLAQRSRKLGFLMLQIAIALLPTSAQERRLSNVFQPRS